MRLPPVAKAVVVGDSGAGKTSLLKRMSENSFSATTKPTVGVEFFVRTLYDSTNKKSVKIQFWDTAGQERFSTLVSSYYNGNQVMLFVFDLSSKSSFLSLESRWVKHASWVKSEATNEYPTDRIVFLVGTKMDNQREVGKEEALLYSATHGMRGYFEVSAKTGEGVEEMFHLIVDELFGRMDMSSGESEEANRPEEPLLVVPNAVINKTIKRRNCWCC